MRKKPLLLLAMVAMTPAGHSYAETILVGSDAYRLSRCAPEITSGLPSPGCPAAAPAQISENSDRVTEDHIRKGAAKILEALPALGDFDVPKPGPKKISRLSFSFYSPSFSAEIGESDVPYPEEH